MTDEREISVAPYEREAADARRRIAMLIDQIQERLSPARLLDDTTDAVADKTAKMVERGRKELQQHPAAVGFVGALIGLVAVRRLTNRNLA